MRRTDCRDVACLVEGMFEHEAQRARDSENLAMLVDRDDYWLTFDYTSGTTDPDDPEVKRERLMRKARRIKPPPLPLIPPVAQRHPDLTAELAERYQAAVEPYRLPDTEQKGVTGNKIDWLLSQLGGR